MFLGNIKPMPNNSDLDTITYGSKIDPNSR